MNTHIKQWWEGACLAQHSVQLFCRCNMQPDSGVGGVARYRAPQYKHTTAKAKCFCRWEVWQRLLVGRGGCWWVLQATATHLVLHLCWLQEAVLPQLVLQVLQLLAAGEAQGSQGTGREQRLAPARRAAGHPQRAAAECASGSGVAAANVRHDLLATGPSQLQTWNSWRSRAAANARAGGGCRRRRRPRTAPRRQHPAHRCAPDRQQALPLPVRGVEVPVERGGERVGVLNGLTQPGLQFARALQRGDHPQGVHILLLLAGRRAVVLHSGRRLRAAAGGACAQTRCGSRPAVDPNSRRRAAGRRHLNPRWGGSGGTAADVQQQGAGILSGPGLCRFSS